MRIYVKKSLNTQCTANTHLCTQAKTPTHLVASELRQGADGLHRILIDGDIVSMVSSASTTKCCAYSGSIVFVESVYDMLSVVLRCVVNVGAVVMSLQS